ncbi:hypothetical protein [Limimaricola soesokkakensis]|nr:hypothetical protein [Limimaricola soesokkakensis]
MVEEICCTSAYGPPIATLRPNVDGVLVDMFLAREWTAGRAGATSAA